MYIYHLKEMLFVSTCRKALMKFAVYGTLLFIAVVMSLIPQLISSKQGLLPRERFPTDLRYILFYDPPLDKKKKTFHHFDNEPKYQTGQSLFIKQKCEYINCYITYNRKFLQEEWHYDAVVFNLHDIKHLNLYEVNLTRAPHQKYIFRSLESSEKYPLCYPFYEDFFNWTWTYKLNSEIPHPFLNIYNINNTFVGPKKNMTWVQKMKRIDKFKAKLKHKKKAVAWIATKCRLKSKHKDFLSSLQKELNSYNHTMEIYGPCGKKQCPGGQTHKCYKMIEKEFYFQLVIEDSFAEDFVSDKLTKVMEHVTIPIVMGGAEYNRFLPPGSYVNTQAFPVKKLVAIVDYLISHPKMYSYFFDWMNHYYYTPRPSNYVCDLCAKLNENKDVSTIYDNFRKWWNPEYSDVCRRINLYNFFNSNNKDYL